MGERHNKPLGAFGGGYDEPSIDYLKKLIADADRTPEERTTAGKKR